MFRIYDFGSKGAAFFSGVNGDKMAPPKVSRILGRKICGNFLAKNYRIFYDLKFYSPWGGSKSLFTPGKKAAPLDPKSCVFILILTQISDDILAFSGVINLNNNYARKKSENS
jgi:hypothetical protein